MTDDKSASLLFSTPLLGQSATLPLRFVVEKAPPGAKQIALWDGEEILGEAPIPDGEKPTIALTVTLPEEPEKQVTFAFQNAVAMPLAEFQIPLHRGDLRPRPTALTRAAVVAKDIGIEVVRAAAYTISIARASIIRAMPESDSIQAPARLPAKPLMNCANGVAAFSM